jgi:hypothetical protein
LGQLRGHAAPCFPGPTGSERWWHPTARRAHRQPEVVAGPTAQFLPRSRESESPTTNSLSKSPACIPKQTPTRKTESRHLNSSVFRSNGSKTLINPHAKKEGWSGEERGGETSPASHPVHSGGGAHRQPQRERSRKGIGGPSVRSLSSSPPPRRPGEPPIRRISPCFSFRAFR